jgi:hypothetical protein
MLHLGRAREVLGIRFRKAVLGWINFMFIFGRCLSSGDSGVVLVLETGL